MFNLFDKGRKARLIFNIAESMQGVPDFIIGLYIWSKCIEYASVCVPKGKRPISGSFRTCPGNCTKVDEIDFRRSSTTLFAILLILPRQVRHCEAPVNLIACYLNRSLFLSGWHSLCTCYNNLEKIRFYDQIKLVGGPR